MKCKYCNADLTENDKVCPMCKKNVDSNVDSDMEVFSDLVEKKKNHKWILVVLIVLLLGVIGFGYYYVTRPDVVFSTLLNRAYKEANKTSEEYKQMKVILDMNASVDMGDEYKEFTDIIKNISINTSINYDSTNDTFALSLKADYKKKELASANMYYENKGVYVELKNLLDKLIKIDVEDENDINITDEDINILFEEVYNALKSTLKVAEYTSSKEKVNGESTNKYTLVINNKNKTILVNSFIDYLLNSEDFINTVVKISETTKDEVLKVLNGSKDVEDLEKDIYVSVYVKSFTNELVKFEVSTKDDVLMTFSEVSKSVYKMEMSIEGVKVIATITEDEKNNKANIVYDIESDVFNAKLTLNMAYVFNEKIQKPNIENSVAIEELTKDDQNTILEKLMENEGVGELMNVFSSLIPSKDPVYDPYEDYDDPFEGFEDYGDLDV